VEEGYLAPSFRTAPVPVVDQSRDPTLSSSERYIGNEVELGICHCSTCFLYNHLPTTSISTCRRDRQDTCSTTFAHLPFVARTHTHISSNHGLAAASTGCAATRNKPHRMLVEIKTGTSFLHLTIHSSNKLADSLLPPINLPQKRHSRVPLDSNSSFQSPTIASTKLSMFSMKGW
jgi:hypothetical protein